MRLQLSVLIAALVVPAMAFAQEDNRPDDWAIGIGGGWTFPAQVLSPGTVSVRARLADGLTFEPGVTFGGTGGTTNTDTEFGGTTTTTEDDRGSFSFVIGTNVRYPVLDRGPLDLVIIGGGFIGRSSSSTNPDGQYNKSESSSTTLGLVYGLAIEWFFANSVVLSADATNPIISYVRSRSRQQLGAVDASSEVIDSSTSGALTFLPTVRLMLHLFF